MRQGNHGRRPRGGRPNRRPGPLKAQTFDSNGPDVRIRGNAHQVYEKYLNLARDATAGGDCVLAESYWQFAEHYYRIIHESTDPESPGSHRPHFRDPRYEDRDGQWDDDDQGGQDQPREQQRDQNRGHQQGRQDGGRDGNRGDGNRNEGGRDGNRQERGDAQANQREGGQRDGNQRDGGQRDGGQRDGGQREGGREQNPRRGRQQAESRDDEDRTGLERTLGGNRANRDESAEEVNGHGEAAEGGDERPAKAEGRGRSRLRRRQQASDEGDSGPGRRPFPPRADDEGAEPATAESGEEG